MSTRVSCPRCKAAYRLGEAHLGKTVLCPSCQQPLTTQKPIRPAAPRRESDALSLPPPLPKHALPSRRQSNSALVGTAVAVLLLSGTAVVWGLISSRQGRSENGQDVTAGGVPQSTAKAGNGAVGEAEPVTPEGGEERANQSGEERKIGQVDGAFRTKDGIKPPGPSEVPSFLVSTSTRQVYRIHLSGLHPLDAARLAPSLRPIIAKLPGDNPLRKALQGLDMIAFADTYRSVRSKLLEAGVDTVYFMAEADWLNTAELPGYVAIPGTTATLDRLRARLRAAGHVDLERFLKDFRPATGRAGWLVCRQGRFAEGERSAPKKALVEHALTESCPVRRASVSVRRAQGLHIDLNATWPITVVHLMPNKADLVFGPILAAVFPATAKMTASLATAEANTVSLAVVPFPFARQVAHVGSERAAQQLAREIARACDAVADKLIGDDDDAGTQLMKMFARSAVQVGTQGKDVIIIMKPPALFDLFAAEGTAQRTQDQDWTALGAPPGHHWELIAAPGDKGRYDILDHVAAVRARGTSGKSRGPDKVAADTALFRVPIDGGLALNVSFDPRGNWRIQPLEDGKPHRLPALELFDDQGDLIGLLRLDLEPGDPRFDLARTLAMIRGRLKERADGAVRAKKDLSDVEDELQKKQLQGKASSYKERTEKLKEMKTSLTKETQALQLMQNVERQLIALQRQFPAATLVKDGDLPSGNLNPLAGKRKRFRFAGEWLFDQGMLTLYQDTRGLVTGTLSVIAKNQQSFEELGILAGKVEGQTLSFTLMYTARKERTGQIILDDDGVGGRWTGDGAPPKGRVDRVDSGFPEAVWFQEVDTGVFEGYWVHASRKAHNTTLEKKQPGVFAGANSYTNRQSKIQASAAGNVMFVIQSPGYFEAKVRQAVLSPDGRTLTFDPPPAGSKKPRPGSAIELTRKGTD